MIICTNNTYTDYQCMHYLEYSKNTHIYKDSAKNAYNFCFNSNYTVTSPLQFFFREDEAISLFFKNSSMSCKKLNNIWYCRFAILEIQNITEKDISEFPRPTTFKRLWLLQKFLSNNFNFFEFHCFPMVCAFHYFTYLDQPFFFYLQFGCPTANFGPLWKAASLAWG